jgi:hypothetical protein
MTRPIPPRKLRPQLPMAAYRWLLAGQRSAWFFLTLTTDPDAQLAFWRAHEDEVVQHHIKRHPGTRPRLWWRYSAPQPRRRVGGLGTPLHECSNTVLHLEYGVPADWRVRGRNDYLGEGVPLSSEHPPLYESEARYLRRLGLLLPEERRRLRPRDFEPCVVVHRGEDRFALIRHDRVERFELGGPLRAILHDCAER